MYLKFDFPYMGETFALLSAIFWAIAVILFKKSGEKVRPSALNLFKNIFASILLVITSLVLGKDIWLQVPLNDYLLLLVSGIIGIGIADTLFLKSLNLLGASRNAIVSCSYSPIMILLSFLFLGERFTWIQTSGAVLIISAVIFTAQAKHHKDLSRRNLFIGIGLILLSNFLIVISVIMIKPLLDGSPLIWATLVRLVGATFTIIVYILLRKDRKELLVSITRIHNLGYMLSGSFFGTYLALMTWLAGMKYTQTSNAAVLNQTNQIFIFLFAAIFLKEKITSFKVVSIMIAIIGAILVTLG